MGAVCRAVRGSAKGADAAADGGAETPPKRTRKPRQPKAETAEAPDAAAASAEAAAAAAEAKPKRGGGRRKAAAEAAPAAVPPSSPQAAPAPAAPPPPQPAPPAQLEALATTRSDAASSVLEDSVKRRRPMGRPRIGEGLADAAEEPEPEFKPAAPLVSPEVVEALKHIESPPWSVSLHPQEVPRTAEEAPYADALLTQRYWDARKLEAKTVEELAWQAHHHASRHAVNRYLSVRRVARLMAEVENHDFMREDKAPHNVPSWARAELIHKEEFDDFNEFVKRSISRLGSENLQLEEEEEARERQDHLDLLSPTGAIGSDADRSKVDQAYMDQSLVVDYLDHILPGVTLSSMSEAFADDIFAADDTAEDTEDAAGGGDVEGAKGEEGEGKVDAEKSL